VTRLREMYLEVMTHVRSIFHSYTFWINHSGISSTTTTSPLKLRPTEIPHARNLVPLHQRKRCLPILKITIPVPRRISQTFTQTDPLVSHLPNQANHMRHQFINGGPQVIVCERYERSFQPVGRFEGIGEDAFGAGNVVFPVVGIEIDVGDVVT
jgi:hypothetical protein